MQMWFREPDFLDENGKPRVLPFAGSSPSFSDLVARAAKGVHPQDALERLLTVEAVARQGRNEVAPLSFSITIDSGLERAGQTLYAVENLLRSIEVNLQVPVAQSWFQREAACFNFDRKQLPRANRYLSQQCFASLEQVDDWMHQYEMPANSKRQDVTTVVVGTYVAMREPRESTRR